MTTRDLAHSLLLHILKLGDESLYSDHVPTAEERDWASIPNGEPSEKTKDFLRLHWTQVEDLFLGISLPRRLSHEKVRGLACGDKFSERHPCHYLREFEDSCDSVISCVIQSDKHLSFNDVPACLIFEVASRAD